MAGARSATRRRNASASAQHLTSGRFKACGPAVSLNPARKLVARSRAIRTPLRAFVLQNKHSCSQTVAEDDRFASAERSGEMAALADAGLEAATGLHGRSSGEAAVSLAERIWLLSASCLLSCGSQLTVQPALGAAEAVAQGRGDRRCSGGLLRERSGRAGLGPGWAGLG